MDEFVGAKELRDIGGKYRYVAVVLDTLCGSPTVNKTTSELRRYAHSHDEGWAFGLIDEIPVLEEAERRLLLGMGANGGNRQLEKAYGFISEVRKAYGRNDAYDSISMMLLPKLSKMPGALEDRINKYNAMPLHMENFGP